MSRSSKTIEITDLRTKIRKKDLILHVSYRIISPKQKFARIKAEIYFDGERIKSFYPIVTQKSTREELPIRSIISLKHMNLGRHTVRADLTGLGSVAGLPDSKKTYFDYRPEVEAPTVEAVLGTGKIEKPRVIIITDDVKKFYQQMRERRKKELIAGREK